MEPQSVGKLQVGDAAKEPNTSKMSETLPDTLPIDVAGASYQEMWPTLVLPINRCARHMQ